MLVLVTGGSSGIGRATAVALARRGWRVVLVGRSRDALDQALAEVIAAGGTGVAEPVDAADAGAMEALAARVLARDGVPDAIVNAAGSGEWRFLEELPASAGARLVSAPYLAAYHACAVFMAAMLARGAGTFVHVGSPASLMPWPGATGYCASRWALRGLHEALVMDLGGTGLRSCHVMLGEVRTAYFERAAGSHERIPGVGRWLPVMSAEAAGAIVAGVVLRPRREVIRPLLLRVFAILHRLAPGAMEAAVRVTGARRR